MNWCRRKYFTISKWHTFNLSTFCSLDTDVEDLREQESVSRILAELLENQEEFFDSDDDDISNTNDYSSINDQVNFLSHVLQQCYYWH